MIWLVMALAILGGWAMLTKEWAAFVAMLAICSAVFVISEPLGSKAHSNLSRTHKGN